MAINAQSILSEEETAARYGISPRTLQRWRVTGDGPKWIRIGLRRVGYRDTDCEEWESKRTFPHRAAELAAKAA